jgi:predicted choloylglycine hydrolase
MILQDLPAGEILRLEGDAYARGRAQARLCPDLADHVRHAVAHRLAETAPAFARADVRDFVAAQHRATQALHPEILDEIAGIADGFGIDPRVLFDYLHCSSAADLAAIAEHRPDGCTAIAATARGGHALVAKNRDYRAEHIPIQRVMLHADPAWNGRRLLVIGSLGSPGNFSSGMNSDGLAIADTASRTSDMGPGLHRYFLLTWLLVKCRDVDQALAAIRGMTHTGSGLLLLGDASGAVAAVELGHRRVGFEHRSSGRVARSNHFVTPAMAPANLDVAGSAASRVNSERRFAALERRLAGLPAAPETADIHALLCRHGEDGGEAFCRHGGDQLSTTISGAIWDTAARALAMASGNPCSATWRRYGF